MGEKKGQVMLFVIVAIVMVGLIFGFFLIDKDVFESEAPYSVKVLKENLDNCFYDNLEGVLDSYGESDGLEEERFYYVDGKIVPHSLDMIEKEINILLKPSFISCLYFYNESISKVSYSYESFESSVSVLDEEVSVILDLVVSFDDGENVYLYDFSREEIGVFSDLKNMNELATYFSESLVSQNEWIIVTEILEMSDSKELEFYYEELENSQVAVMFVSKRDFSPKNFVFYNKLNYFYPSEVGVLL